MLGMKSKEEAKRIYIKCMTKRHFNGVEEISKEEFIKMAKESIKRVKSKK